MVFLTLRNTRRVEKAMSPILRGIQDLSRGSYQPWTSTENWRRSTRGSTEPGIT